jgi:hypothetical protein
MEMALYHHQQLYNFKYKKIKNSGRMVIYTSAIYHLQRGAMIGRQIEMWQILGETVLSIINMVLNFESSVMTLYFI